ncbi:spore coat protein U domain-containing protein [Rickettsia helvetica]|uniref:Spore coat protein U/FanG domain-containing protein n=1 Tax=Rickettsia helvetica TaxID=35789 RepID=A0ABM9NCW4_RICHE
MLVPNITPYVPSEIRLDDENLPLNTEFEDISLKVAPKTKLAVLLINIIISGNAVALLATCNISVPTVSFGSFAVSSVRTTSVNAMVTCSGLLSLLVSYTVTFSTGAANIYNPSNMINGVRKLHYNLYKDAGFTQILEH